MSYSEYLRLSEAALAALQEMSSKEILQGMEEHIGPEWKEEAIEAVGRKSNQQGAGWVDPMAMMEMERDASMKRIEANFEKLLDREAVPSAEGTEFLKKIDLLTDDITQLIAREAVPSAEGNDFLKKIDLLTDDLTQMIAQVAAHPSTDRNKKMIKIVELDRRFLAFTSAKWGELLDCSDGCIRKQPFWKSIIKSEKARTEFRSGNALNFFWVDFMQKSAHFLRPEERAEERSRDWVGDPTNERKFRQTDTTPFGSRPSGSATFRGGGRSPAGGGRQSSPRKRAAHSSDRGP